jgi:succinate dehydrogenase/fumarate reductase-like Fe-S protein
METVTVEVVRTDPRGSEPSRLDKFTVPFEEGMRIVDALEYIFQELDHTLAYRCSCLISNCQICLIKANGKTVYACQEALANGMVLEPLPEFAPVRDLVTDLSKRLRGEDEEAD